MTEDEIAAALAKHGMLNPEPKVAPDYSQPYLYPEVEADVRLAANAVKLGIKPILSDDLPEALKERDEFLKAQLKLHGIL
jgi:hypothetical protein